MAKTGFVSLYNTGSSREHAALVPLYLGIRAVIAVSFARIHRSNLINSGIVPLQFKNPSDYDKLNEYDELVIKNLIQGVKDGVDIIVENRTGGFEFPVYFKGSKREMEVLEMGGYLNYSVKSDLGV